MHTKWDSSKPKQKDNAWIITGIMADENKNSFHITVTTPTSPKTNRLDLMNFMKLQADDRYKKIDIVFVASDQPSEGDGQPQDIQFDNLYVSIAPTHITTTMTYGLEISDSIGDDRAAQGSRYPYSVNNTKLYVSCSVDMGRVKMTVADESKTLNGGETGQITRSNATPVLWNIIFECLGPQNRFNFKMTDQVNKEIL